MPQQNDQSKFGPLWMDTKTYHLDSSDAQQLSIVPFDLLSLESGKNDEWNPSSDDWYNQQSNKTSASASIRSTIIRTEYICMERQSGQKRRSMSISKRAMTMYTMWTLPTIARLREFPFPRRQHNYIF